MQLSGVSLQCFLHWSKIDQADRGMRVVMHELMGSPMCPMAFLKYGELHGVGLGPLLVHETGTFLSKFQLIQVFRKCLVGLDKHSGAYSSHSFRMGAATEAAQLG